MKAVDTNIVLRLLTGDDPRQEALALALLGSTICFVSLTVVLESEWVLRSHYRWSPDRIANALRGFAALEGIDIERVAGVLWAADRLASGADFADMIHIVSAGDAEAFATFDQNIERQAGSGTPIPIETLA